MPKFIDELDVVQSNTLSNQSGNTITKPASSTENLMIVETLAAGANNPANKATRFLEGAVLTITDPHNAVDSAKYPDSEFKKPTTYKRKITKVIDGTNVVVPPYKITRKSDGQKRAVPLNKFSFSITYEKSIIKPNTSGVFKKSYADIQYSNLQTFSGDVYKAKVFTKEKGSQGDYEKIGEVVLDGQNQLINNNGVTGFETIGVFHTQSIVSDGWVTSSDLSSATQGEDNIAASVLLSGSNGANTSDFTFLTSGSYGLQRNEDYMVSFDTYFFKENKTDSDGNINKKAEIEVYLTGSINSPTASEVSLGVLDDAFEGMKGRTEGRIDGVFNYFKTHNKAAVQPETKLGFRVKSGRFKLANVSLTPYFEKNFNPVSFRTLLPMPKPVKRGQRFDFYTEFYDFNNNKANFLAETSSSVVFDGAPQVLADGVDALLTGSVFLGSTEGQGIELHGGSAYMRSVGYQGFKHAIDNNNGGFLIYSGSIGSTIGATESGSAPQQYIGTGLEIVDAHGTTDKFMRFNTSGSGIFEIATDTFILGSSGSAPHAGAFISGSNGNLRISSSGFFLDTDGSINAGDGNFTVSNAGAVTLAGTITAAAGGTIGGFTVGTDKLSGGTDSDYIGLEPGVGIQLGDATFADAEFSVTNAGVLKSTAGTIGGFTIASNGLKSANDSFQVTGSTGQITGSSVLFSGGTIGGFNITDSKIESKNFTSGLKGIRISTEGNGTIEAENARIRGTLSTTTFEKESVNAVGGQLLIANSTMITGSQVGSSDTTMSVENVTGFEANEILFLKKVSGTGFSNEYVLFNSSSRASTDDNNLTGRIMVTRGYQSSVDNDSRNSGSVSETSDAAQTYEPGQVIVSTGKEDTGYIKLNANPNDVTTPYIDIVERTGSGIYDVDLKARLGDLSGISTTLVGSSPGFGLFSENVFLTGKITSTAGAIGGWTLSANDLSSGNVSFNSNTELLKLGAVTDFTKDGTDKGILIGKDGSDYEFFVGAENGNFIHWNGSSLSVAGSITITNPGDIDISDLNNDSGFTDDTAANSAQSTANTANSAASTADGKAVTAQNAANTAQAAVDVVESRVIITGNDVTVAHNSGENKGIFNAAGLTIIGNDVTGSTFTATTSSIFGASSADRTEVTDGGLKVYKSNTQVASFGSAVRVGLEASDKTALRIDSSGNLTIGTSGTQEVSIAANGSATFSGDLSAAGGTFSGQLVIGGSNTSLTTTALAGALATEISGSAKSGSIAAMGTAATGISDAASAQSAANTAQAAVDVIETRVVIDNNGLELRNNSGATLSSFRTDVQLGTTGSNERNLHIDKDVGITMFNGAHSAANRLATFGSNIDLPQGQVHIGTSGSNEPNLFLTSDGVALRQGTTSILTVEDSGDISVSGSILEKTRLFGNGVDGTIVLYHNNTDATFKASTTRVNNANGAAIINRSSATWSMAGDVYCDNLTLSATGGNTYLKTNGFRLYVKNTLALASGTIIDNPGTKGSDGVNGDLSRAGGSGGAGGAGGTLQSGSTGGAGGAGGSGNSAGGAGGGGAGGSGGHVFVAAKTINNSGIIRSLGGAGGAGGVGENV